MKLKILQIILAIFSRSILGMENQVSSISYVGHIPKEVIAVKRNLHKDFYNNAKINGLVSYIYYPSGQAKQGHAELELEGNSWDLSSMWVKHESLEEKIKRSTTIDPHKTYKMLGRYFKRYVITVSPKELEQLRKNIENEADFKISSIPSFLLKSLQHLTYKTCSNNVLSMLSKNCNFNVPLPFKISPFLSQLYILHTKPSKIQKVEYYGNRYDYDGEIGECIIMATTITSAAGIIYLPFVL